MSKKGSGTRGGTIVGYTKTGNPIYAKRSRITGVSERTPTKKISGKEKQRRDSSKEKKTDAASALPEGQRKKIQNLITKLKHTKKSQAAESSAPITAAPVVDKTSADFKRIISVDDRKDVKKNPKEFAKKYKKSCNKAKNKEC